jgi:adenylylsulfate kinase
VLEHDGMILWLTGLPAAGKTTVASNLSEVLKTAGAQVYLLDGDVVRALNNNRLGFSREDRITHMIQVGNTAKMLKDCGKICIVALISPYREIRQEIIRKVGAIEIFVDAPLEVCRNRDPKGLYALAQRGEIKNFTGVDDPYDAPLHPQVHLHTHLESPEESAQHVLAYLQLRGLVDEQDGFLNQIYQPYPTERILGRFPWASLLLFKRHGLSSRAASLFLSDCLQFLKLKRYPYKRRILFVAGLPKSGTTWMNKLLSMVPGYCSRTIYDPSRSTMLHDVSPMTFQLLPQYAYSVAKLHTRYTHYNFNTILNYADRFVLMYRDLRDMCVSRYFHVLNEETQRHYKLYHSLPKEEGILHSINIIRKEYVKWVADWYEVAQANSDKILTVRYEDLHADVSGTMKKVLSFYEIPYQEALLEKMAETQLRKPVALKESLAKGETKRRGIIGEWREHFTQEHKDYFKDFAGPLLIQLGYEQDNEW